MRIKKWGHLVPGKIFNYNGNLDAPFVYNIKFQVISLTKKQVVVQVLATRDRDEDGYFAVWETRHLNNEIKRGDWKLDKTSDFNTQLCSILEQVD